MLRTVFQTLRAAIADRRGVTAAEYAILAVGVVIIVGTAASTLGPKVQGAFTNVGNAIDTGTKTSQ